MRYAIGPAGEPPRLFVTSDDVSDAIAQINPGEVWARRPVPAFSDDEGIEMMPDVSDEA